MSEITVCKVGKRNATRYCVRQLADGRWEAYSRLGRTVVIFGVFDTQEEAIRKAKSRAVELADFVESTLGRRPQVR